ncbi:MPP_superfamily domain containing protein [uncultured Caudovirales phage]|uniref:MPP_superfamily domain containing protein n=1 Tax=uncultured Caudovirales phage TaxID=2100421 RepID=A0A6J5M1V6_9CAUD|nr:MPP_superfamily domain containing protein [uncultured Caudovirales phage]
MANIGRAWKRVIAIGCTHGYKASLPRLREVLAFVARYQPEYRFELGDLVDTEAFRSGAKGTPDEGKDPRPDQQHGLDWLDQYAPTHIAWGNHDVRLLELSSHPSAIVAYAASTLWGQLTSKADELKAKTVPYDIEKGWHYLGGVAWGHGYMYNVNAVRDHAEMLGCPVVMAHLHKPEATPGRTVKDSMSYCVGTLSDIDSMHYARRRRATLQWGHGCVWGEICDGKKPESNLYLTRSVKGEPLRFPL